MLTPRVPRACRRRVAEPLPAALAVCLCLVSSAPRTLGAQSIPVPAPREAAIPPSGAPTQEPWSPADPGSQDHPLVIERLHTHYRFEADGAGRREGEASIRVQTDGGVQALGQLVFDYNAGSERLEFDYVRVRQGSDIVAEAGPEAILDLAAPVALEAPIYTDLRQKHVTVPRLRPGTVLEYRVIVYLEEPLAPGQFWMEHTFERYTPVLSETLEVDVPTERPVHLRWDSRSEPATSEADGRTVYRWSHAQPSPLPAEDRLAVPGHAEPPDVELSSFRDWAEVGAWYESLQREPMAPTRELRDRAVSLTAGLDDERQKTEALFRFVSTEFRYVSLSFGLGRYQPHSAAEVLANGYGDCKDKHTLLAALLGAVGIEAYPVLVSSSRRISAEVPSPGQFDHLISAVRLPEELVWLDATLEVAPLGVLSPTVRGKPGLLVAAKGLSELSPVPDSLPFASVYSITVQGRIDDAGNLTASVEQHFRGDREILLRATFRSLPRTEWREVFRSLARLQGVAGSVDTFQVGDPLATRQPFSLAYVISRPAYLDGSTEQSLPILLPRLHVAEPDDRWGHRPLPLELATVSQRLVLGLPPAGFEWRLPAPVALERPFASYRSGYSLQGPVLMAERTLVLRVREVPADALADYRAFVRAIRKDLEQSLVAKRSGDGELDLSRSADAAPLAAAGYEALQKKEYERAIPLLRRVTELQPEHPQAWNHLGYAYLETGDLERAEEAFRRQVELHPYDELVHNYLGVLLERQQRHEEAILAYKKQLDVDPLHSYANRNLGALFVRLERYEEAIPYLETAKRLAPQDPQPSGLLGLALAHAHGAADALPELERAVSLQSDDADALHRLAWAFGQAGRYADAIPVLRKAVQLAPRNLELRADLASALALAGRYREAASAYGEARRLAPEQRELELGYLESLARAGPTSEAVADLRRQLQDAPDDAARQAELAYLLWFEGRYGEALQPARAAVRLDPSNGLYWGIRGTVEYRTGHRAEALRAFERAAELFPPYFEVMDQEQEIYDELKEERGRGGA